jgi:hypothetical protein
LYVTAPVIALPSVLVVGAVHVRLAVFGVVCAMAVASAHKSNDDFFTTYL